MPSDDRSLWSRGLTWRIAALWMVVLALGLALVGIILALQQARSLSVRLMAPAEAYARGIADRALKQFEREVSAGLFAVTEHLTTAAERPWKRPSSLPTWFDGLFVWTGSRLDIIAPPSAELDGLLGVVETRLAAKLATPHEPARQQVEVLYDSIGSTPVVLACLESTDASGGRFLVAARVDLARLRSDLVEPFLSTDSGLELVRSRPGRRYMPWSQRLFSAMRFWEIQPTQAFIREQERAVVGQTLVHLGITVLSLATLLIAMWVLVRVVRRETALAEMKANFVADVSHELKTPLALIRLFGETLHSGRVASEAKRQEYYEIITRESTRLTNLINNILDFARIEAGRKEYNLQATNVADVVRETYDAYRVQLEHDGFEHHLTMAASLPQVDADADAIAQAVINLINNAIKYCGDERYLAIDVTEDTRRGRRGVLISVHDRGIGIRPEDRAHLFDGFFRAGDVRVRAQGGAGLGLALVKHIVDAHHGSLDVESRLVKGCTFRIFLPASERRPPLVENARSAGSNSSPGPTAVNDNR